MELLVHRARVARVLEVARGMALRALFPTHVGEAQARLLPLPAEALGLVPPRILRSGPVPLKSLARLLLVLPRLEPPRLRDRRLSSSESSLSLEPESERDEPELERRRLPPPPLPPPPPPPEARFPPPPLREELLPRERHRAPRRKLEIGGVVEQGLARDGERGGFLSARIEIERSRGRRRGRKRRAGGRRPWWL
eukprot:scaffold16452_cov116-Isochrysis_galbana.AAC.1